MNSPARGGVGLLLTRVQRRLHRSLWVRKARRDDRHYRGLAGADFERRLATADLPATLPGPRALPVPAGAEREAAAIEAREILQHRFRLFGTLRESVAADRAGRGHELARELPRDLVDDHDDHDADLGFGDKMIAQCLQHLPLVIRKMNGHGERNFNYLNNI
jgi:hypothetical protein